MTTILWVFFALLLYRRAVVVPLKRRMHGAELTAQFAERRVAILESTTIPIDYVTDDDYRQSA